MCTFAVHGQTNDNVSGYLHVRLLASMCVCAGGDVWSDGR